MTKIKITKGDLNKANKAFNNPSIDGRIPVTRCCLIYQACNRVGIPVTSVAITTANLGEYRNVILIGVEDITKEPAANWQKFVGRSFEIDYDLPKKKRKLTTKPRKVVK